MLAKSIVYGIANTVFSACKNRVSGTLKLCSWKPKGKMLSLQSHKTANSNSIWRFFKIEILYELNLHVMYVKLKKDYQFS